jgi:hypothetical protein
MPTWNTASDWDSATAESGVVHESVSNTDHNDDTVVKRGYPIASPIVSNGLIHYYPLQESSGPAIDFAGNTDANTNNVNFNVSTPLSSTGYEFSDNGYASLSVTSLSSGSLSAWVYPHSIDNNSGFLCLTQNNVFGLVCAADTSFTDIGVTARGATGSRADISTGGSGKTNEWQHVAATWDGSTLELYYNGTSQGTDSLGSMNNNKGEGAYIGRRGNVSGYEDYYDGKIFDCRIYNRALSASEVQTIYDVVNTNGTLTTDYRSA